ncbi:MAG TPA: hypothetical protein VF606_01820, partial [Geminicoccaceae bacterium]
YFMGLNLSNRQIARELDLGASDVQAMTEVLRRGLTARAPAVVLKDEVEIDEVYVVAGHIEPLERRRQRREAVRLVVQPADGDPGHIGLPRAPGEGSRK